MAKKFSIYWYKEPEFAGTGLFNLRDDDIRHGGKIEQGDILVGCVGVAVAEQAVAGRNGNVVEFRPNRRCTWKGFELPCMTLSALPGETGPAGRIGVYNYAVVPVTDDAVRAAAERLKIPCVEIGPGAWVFNVELTRFPGQDKRRQATLV